MSSSNNPFLNFGLAFLLLFCISFSFGQEKSKDHYQGVLNKLIVSEQQVFRANSGQYDDEFLFNTSGANASASFSLDQVQFSLIKDVKFGQNPENPFETRASFLNWSMGFVGASTQNVSPENQIQRNINYFGPGAKNGVSLKEYTQLTYLEIYPKTDLKFYSSKKGALKYDFILRPGADINQIKLEYKGINSITVLPSGELSLQTDWGEFREDKPYCYQVIDGKVIEVEVNYVVNGENYIVFEAMNEYDTAYSLIIDPIYVDWSTYFYGEAVTGANGWNYVLDIDIDDEDFVYITGMSYNQRFVSQLGGYDTTYDTGYDAFLCKITPRGDSLRYFTFIGGSNLEYSMNVAVGASYQAVISGITWGGGFPTTSGAYDEKGRTCSGSWCYQGFVTKFSKNGDSLVYSTFLGGRSYSTSWAIDFIRGMQVTENGNVYLVGNTQSEDFPTTSGCYQSQYGGQSTGTGSWWWNSGDAFLTCINPSGSNLVFSTYLGGAGNDVAFDLFVVSTGEIYVVGKTNSSNFKTTPGASVFNTYIKGGSDGFIVKFKSKAKQIEFAKLMGGTGEESFEGIYANDNGEPYIVGSSNSSNFPVSSSAFQKSNAGSYDLVVVKLISSGTNFRYSTYLGGSGIDGYSANTWYFDNMSITANVKEEAIISATTKSNNFPITSDALQSSNNSGTWWGKLTISKLSYKGDQLKYGTYWGGSKGEFPGGIKAKRVGCVTFVLFAGNSYSGDYPTTKGVYKESRSSGTFWTGFVTKFRDTLYTETIALAFQDTIIECDNVFQILDAQNQGADFLWSDGWTDRFKIAKDTGTLWVRATYGCDTARDTLNIQLEYSPRIPVLGPDTTYCDNFPNLTLDAKNDTIYRDYLWSTKETSQTINVSSPGTYYVDINTPNCGTKTDTVHLKLLKTPDVDLGADKIECDSVRLTLDAANANNEVEYRWNTGDSVQLISVLDTGLYGVRVTNFCGTDSSDILLGKYDFPIAALPKDSIFCDTVSMTLKAGKADNGETYEWSSVDGSIIYATSSTLKLTDDKDLRLVVKNSCGTAEDTLYVTQLVTPNDWIKDTLLACDVVDEILSVGLVDNGETYKWSTGSNNYEIKISSLGTYYGITKNLCGVDTSYWTVLLSFTPTVDLPSDSTFCGTVNYTLDVTDQDREMIYTWQDGTSTPGYTVNKVGKYSVILKNRCGEASDSVEYKLLQKPIADIGLDRVFCGGVTPFDITAGTANNDETYDWSDGGRTNTLTVSSPGDHWVVIRNLCGLDSDTMNVRISQIPVVNLGEDTILCGNFSLKLDAGNIGMQYLWIPYGETTRTIEAKEQRIYQVKVINGDGCTGLDEFEIGSGCISHVYIPSSFTPNHDGLNDEFKASLVNFENFTMSIYNRWGELMFETNDVEKGWDATYKGSQVPDGVYLYSIRLITTEDSKFQNLSGLLHVIR